MTLVEGRRLSKILAVKQLTKARCIEYLNDLITVSGDVSDWGEEQFLSDLPGKWNLSFTIWGDGIVAYAILSRKWSDRIHIHQFMVKAAFRSSGIGSLMIDRILEEYGGVEDISLKVHNDNEGAIEFYKRKNFVTEEFKDDYIWMFYRG